MKIHKNSASIDLSLDDFLELLEEDALDDILELLTDLDETGVMNPNNDSTAWEEAFSDAIGNPDDYEIYYLGELDGEEYDELFSNPDNSLLDEILGNLLFSNEDLKVRRIVDRFHHIEDAS